MTRVPAVTARSARRTAIRTARPLNKLLTKKEQKDEAKALEALAKVEAEKAEGAEKTFGELLAAGKLPFLYEGFDYAGSKDDERTTD